MRGGEQDMDDGGRGGVHGAEALRLDGEGPAGEEEEAGSANLFADHVAGEADSVAVERADFFQNTRGRGHRWVRKIRRRKDW